MYVECKLYYFGITKSTRVNEGIYMKGYDGVSMGILLNISIMGMLQFCLIFIVVGKFLLCKQAADLVVVMDWSAHQRIHIN